MRTLYCIIGVLLTISVGFCQSGKEFLDRGREKIKLNNYGDAIADFTKAIEIDSQNVDAFFLRGSMKIIIDDCKGGIADLGKAMQIKSSADHQNKDMKSGADSQNRTEEKTNKNNMDKILPNNSCIYCHTGYANAKLDNPLVAISWYDKAIEADPKSGETFYKRGIAKLLIGKREDGCSDLGKATELGYKQAKEALKNYCP